VRKTLSKKESYGKECAQVKMSDLMAILGWRYLGIFALSWVIYLVPFPPVSTMLFIGRPTAK